jgi:hypothetical protein
MVNFVFERCRNLPRLALESQVLTKSAVGHKRSTKIERVENNGCDVYGQFHSDQWEDFRTCFRFHLTPDHKIKRLDIGQA